MNWKNKNVFITGASGLLGSWLAKYMVDAGANVICLCRDNVSKSLLWDIKNKINIVNGNLEEYQLLERTLNEYEIETVFHLGAQTIVGTANRNPMSTFESNIRGTYNLLEACRRNDKTVKAVVVASSDKAYGNQDKLPYEEDAPLHGSHPYDVSKSCADLLAYTYFNTYKLPVCVTRCGNLYGAGDLNFNRIIPGTIRSIWNGERPVIRSDGSLIRDYFYVKDGALAYKHLAECMYELGIAGDAFNFSNEIQLTVIELVKKISDIIGSNLEPEILGTSKNEIIHQYLSAKKAHDILGWYPKYTLDEGLKETIDWYRTQFRKS